MPSGFNLTVESFDWAFDYGEVDLTSFDDEGYYYGEVTSCKLTATVAGFLDFDAANTAPLPSAFLASTFAPASGAGATTLTFATGCTLAATMVVTGSGGSRSAKAGTRADATHTLVNQGAVTQTWDETP